MAIVMQAPKIRKMTDDERKLFTGIRLDAVKSAPYFSSAIFRVTPVSVEGLETWAVDAHWRMYIDFSMCEKWNHYEQVGVFLHEISHLVRQHSRRAEGVGVRLGDMGWNLAADAEINDDLVEMSKESIKGKPTRKGEVPERFLMPEGLVYPSFFKQEDGSDAENGQVAEYYYSLLPTKPCSCDSNSGQQDDSDQQDSQDDDQDQDGSGGSDDQQDGQDGDQDGDGGNGSGDDQDGDQDGDGGNGSGDDQDGDQDGSGGSDGDGQDSDQQGQQDGSGSGGQDSDGQGGGSGSGYDPNCPVHGGHEHGAASGQCGTGAGGKPTGYELSPEDGNFPGISEAESELLRRKIAQDVQEHQRKADIQNEKSIGNVPAGLRRWADETLAPAKIPWRQQLRSAVRQHRNAVAGNMYYSYSRVSRRNQDNTFIFPGMKKPVVTVGTVIDTSGSMSEKEIVACLQEVEGIVKKAGIRGKEHQLLTVDAQASTPQPVTSVSKIKMQGGGGTDMRVGIDAVSELKPRPEICIVFTDGYTPWPVEKNPKAPRLIVCLVGTQEAIDGAKSGYAPPEWATVVEVDIDE